MGVGGGGGGSGGEVKVCMLTHIYAQNPTNPLRTINKSALIGWPMVQSSCPIWCFGTLKSAVRPCSWHQIPLLRPDVINKTINWEPSHKHELNEGPVLYKVQSSLKSLSIMVYI